MKLGSLASARPIYYDRNASITTAGYYNTVGPHLATTRFTVTAASGKNIFVDAGSAVVMRATAAAPVDYVRASLQQPAGQIICPSFLYNNTVGATNTTILAGSILVTAGSSLIGDTYDQSTGGTILYSMFIHGVIFDA